MKVHTIELQEWVDELTVTADELTPGEAWAMILGGCLLFWAVVAVVLYGAFQ